MGAACILRGAVIGCGFFAANQMNAWRDIEGAAIAAVCDRDAARLDTAGERFGIGDVVRLLFGDVRSLAARTSRVRCSTMRTASSRRLTAPTP